MGQHFSFASMNSIKLSKHFPRNFPFCFYVQIYVHAQLIAPLQQTKARKDRILTQRTTKTNSHKTHHVCETFFHMPRWISFHFFVFSPMLEKRDKFRCKRISFCLSPVQAFYFLPPDQKKCLSFRKLNKYPALTLFLDWPCPNEMNKKGRLLWKMKVFFSLLLSFCLFQICQSKRANIYDK